MLLKSRVDCLLAVNFVVSVLCEKVARLVAAVLPAAAAVIVAVFNGSMPTCPPTWQMLTNKPCSLAFSRRLEYQFHYPGNVKGWWLVGMRVPALKSSRSGAAQLLNHVSHLPMH
eukprot:scaffold316504_cov17-Tisochrysis_lutea.AAC.1